jgi:hypothetical protein
MAAIIEKQRLEVGACPTATHFLLLRQKKVSKEKATQVRRPFGVPCAARENGPDENSGSLCLGGNYFEPVLALSHSLRTAPALAALLGGSHGVKARTLAGGLANGDWRSLGQSCSGNH